MQMLNVIDVFAGGGGLSEGFTRAGFRPVAHVEVDNNSCLTLKTRKIYHFLKSVGKRHIYNQYLKGEFGREELYRRFGKDAEIERVINKEIGGKNTKEIFSRIESFLEEGEEIDILAGGPPCQAYSYIGRARDKNGMKGDQRNFLYKEYGKFLSRFTPKVFVFENVMGLLTAKDGVYFKNMKAYFRRIGYELQYEVLNASDFNVLQNRKRVIIIGWKKGMEFSYPEFSSKRSKNSVKDLLDDLKPVSPGEKSIYHQYGGGSNAYLRSSGIRNGERFVTQHNTRTHIERDIDIYKIAVRKWIDDKERLSYPDLPEKLKTHKNQKSFLDRYKVVDPDGYSHTMVAHISKDGHHYIYPSKEYTRSLSIREAARIQSFPDNYYFEGGQGAAFRQIGNAVPPLMGEGIAKEILKMLV